MIAASGRLDEEARYPQDSDTPRTCDSDTGHRMTGVWAVCICGTEAVQPFQG